MSLLLDNFPEFTIIKIKIFYFTKELHIKNKARFLSFLLVVITSFSLFTGCGPPTDAPIQETSATTPIETTVPDVTTEEVAQTTSPTVYKGINIDVVELDKYTIIYSKDDIFAKYAAENLSYVLISKYKIDIAFRSDSSKETEYEILIGNTKRTASSLEHAPLSDGEFILCKVDSKIVCLVNNYMVGGGVGKLLSLYFPQHARISISQAFPQQPERRMYKRHKTLPRLYRLHN